MGKLNSMENATIAISMVIKLMNSKKANVINVKNMGTNPHNEKLRY